MASVFVGDLPSDVTEADLYSKFSQLGTVSSVKLCRDKESGRSLCYGYVMYQDLDDAEKAVETFNCDLMNNQNIRVVKVGKVNFCHALQGNVFVKNLDRTVDSNMLYRAFSSYGNIITCKVPHGKKGSKCHGFVQFETEAAARAAISSMSGTMFYGKKLYVGHCVNRVQREPTTDTTPASGSSSSSMRTVYIKNISPTVDSVFLKITCSPYGEVANVKIIRDTDGSSKGFAFVTFKKVEEAAKAIEMLNGKEVDGRILFAGAAMKKAGRKQQQQHQYQQQQQQQQHGLQDITIEENIIVEQHQNSKKHQQQNKLKQQLLQQNDETKNVQLLPAMLLRRQQQPQQLNSQPSQQLNSQPSQQRWQQSFVESSPCAIHFPNIGNCQGVQRCEINKLLQLPQIHQQIRSLQQQLKQQNSFEQLKQQDQLQHQVQEVIICQKYPENEHQPMQDSQQQIQSQNNSQQLAPSATATSTTAVPIGVNLYVKHLEEDVNDVILKDMFAKFGEVISAKVMMEGEKSRGFGFVCFARAEDAARATRDMRRRVDDVNRKPLYVAPAQRKEERQAFFREKLKSRQADIHSGDVDIAQKVMNPLETSNDQQESSGQCQQVLHLPAGDSSNSLGKLKIAKNESSKVPEAHGKIVNFSLSSQCSSANPEKYGCHCMKMANANRSLPKRNMPNLFNCELFNVESLRTPLIKPTRLTNRGGELFISSGGLQEMTPSGPIRIHSGETNEVPSEGSVCISKACVPKPLNITKRSGDFTESRRYEHNSPWKLKDYDDRDMNVFTRNSAHRMVEERSQHMTPIGYKLGFSENQIPVVRNVKDKLRPIQCFNLRESPPSRSTSSFQMEGQSAECNVSKVKILSKEEIFSDAAQNFTESLTLKPDQSDFDTVYDALDVIPFPRNTFSEIVKEPFHNAVSRSSTLFSRIFVFPGVDSYTPSENGSIFKQDMRSGFPMNESFMGDSQIRLCTCARSLCPELGPRESPNLKRRSDVAFDSDADDSGFGANSHLQAKRRMVMHPSQYVDGNNASEQYNEVGTTLILPPTTSEETTLDLRVISSWPMDRQSQMLSIHVNSHVMQVLETAMQTNISCPQSQTTYRSQDLQTIIQSLVNREWTVGTLAERLTSMLMELDVTDILNLLQSREYLVYMTSKGLNQIENVDYSNDSVVMDMDKSEPTTLAGNSVFGQELKISQFKNNSKELDL